jgi:hypothetical protein
MANLRDFKNKNTKFTGTDGIVIPVGTTSGTGPRPGSPDLGTLRYNTTTGLPEFYTGAGWSAVAPPPTVTTISGTINENTNSTITVNGTNFTSGSIVSITGAAVSSVARPLTTTFVNSGQVTAATNAAAVNYVGGASFDVTVTNTSGLAATLTTAGAVDRDPTWSTSAGTVATINDQYGSYSNIATLSASDPDGGATTFSLASGSLPGNTSLSSGGVISGNPTNESSSTTYSFTVAATSNGQSTNRSFNIIVNPVLDGSTSARAATSASSIRSNIISAGGTTGDFPDGSYYIKPVGESAHLTYCRFNYTDGGDWMLLLKVHNRADMDGDSANWANNTLINATDMNLTSGSWSKYGIWNTFAFNRLMMVMAGRIPPIMIFSTARTMFNAVNLTTPRANGVGVPATSSDPQISTSASTRYDSMPMKSGSPFASQTGNEPFMQQWGINVFTSGGPGGAYVGCPTDEGGHVFNAASNGGGDSGFGFGGCAGNTSRRWSAGYGEWSSSEIVDTLPGYLWVR